MFEFLSHQRIRQQLENLKERHPQMSQYLNFEEIPERLRVTSRIRAWMAFGARGFESIPERYLRDSMIFQGIYEKRLLGFSAHTFKTSRYKQMLLFSAWCHHSGVWQIPVVYLTASSLTALAVFKSNPLNSLIQKPLYESIFDSRLANEMISVSPRSLSLLTQFPGRFKIKKESVIAGILTTPFCYGSVSESGSLPILEDMLREGFWPGEHDHIVEQSERAGLYWGERPTGPREAFERRAIASGCEPNVRGEVLPLFSALFNIYPKDLVMAELAASQQGCSFLFDLYEEADIREYAKKDRRLRGALLERDMGGFDVVQSPTRRPGWR